MKNNTRPQWLRNRGYIHLTNQVGLDSHELNILRKISDPNYIAKHAFFPLLHSNIYERRYKKIDRNNNTRAHSSLAENNEVKKNIKSRPLHYSTHIDAMIYGYYAEVLLMNYENLLLKHPEVGACILAYRKIPENNLRNKSTINFANEAFQEIKNRACSEECVVLKFDIKSFFSRINHSVLKEAWASVLGATKLPNDHYNVFKAVTKFSYILQDDLRVSNSTTKKKFGYDEKKLASIRKKGIHAYFETPREFREKIKNKEIKIHRFPFRNKEGFPVGIPQGLPISAVLANLYLFNFDLKVVANIIVKYSGYYRRYSDDIIIICKPEHAFEIEEFIYDAIKESKVEMSKEKVERFVFTKSEKNGINIIQSNRVLEGKQFPGVPFTYLGFEFYGNKTLIKSANIARFYRRMIYSVKRKAALARKIAALIPGSPIVIYRNQLYKLYSSYPLSRKKIYTTQKKLQRNQRGEYYYITRPIPKRHRSNYISYVNRASQIMNEPAITNQIRNHKKIFTEAIKRHLHKRLH